MKKIFQSIAGFLSAVTLVFAATAFVGCKDKGEAYLGQVKSRWDVEFPSSMELVYSCKNVGFGDGAYFYVYRTEENLSSAEFVPMDEETADEIDRLCASLLKDLDGTYALNREHKTVYRHYSQHSDLDNLYLIYDEELSRLTVFESI